MQQKFLTDETIIPVTQESLAGEVLKLKEEGYRFVTLSCTELDADHVDLLYHFDKDLTLVHLRLKQAKKDKVPSISAILFAALLVENEIRDLFGLEFDGLILDFNRTLYLDKEVRQVPLVSNVKI